MVQLVANQKCNFVIARVIQIHCLCIWGGEGVGRGEGGGEGRGGGRGRGDLEASNTINQLLKTFKHFDNDCSI